MAVTPRDEPPASLDVAAGIGFSESPTLRRTAAREHARSAATAPHGQPEEATHRNATDSHGADPDVDQQAAVTAVAVVLRPDWQRPISPPPRRALLGRDPEPEPGEEPAVLLTVDDPQLSVSKTHLSLTFDGVAVWICDRGSTNGTTLVTPQGVRLRCAPGDVVRAEPGSVVFLGERRLEVAAATAADVTVRRL